MHYYQARILQSIAGLASGKSLKVQDFLIDFDEQPKSQTSQDHQRIMFQALGLKEDG